MPYKSNAELPKGVRDNLPASAQSIWRNAWNSSAEKYGEDAEERNARIAWGAVKNAGWHKGKGGVWTKTSKMVQVPDPEDLTLTLEAKISKSDDSAQTLFGWASIAVRKDGQQIEDLQGDLIDIEDLEAAWYAYVLESGELNILHKGDCQGQLIEAIVFTPEKLEALGLPAGSLPLGAWCGYFVEDAACYQMIKAQGYFMFSIEGSAIREPV